MTDGDLPENPSSVGIPDKKYLLVVDAVGMAMLSRLCGSVGFVSVQSMTIDNNDNFNVLVTPKIPESNASV